jgi:hypothetical protein
MRELHLALLSKKVQQLLVMDKNFEMGVVQEV